MLGIQDLGENQLLKYALASEPHRLSDDQIKKWEIGHININLSASNFFVDFKRKANHPLNRAAFQIFAQSLQDDFRKGLYPSLNAVPRAMLTKKNIQETLRTQWPYQMNSYQKVLDKNSHDEDLRLEVEQKTSAKRKTNRNYGTKSLVRSCFYACEKLLTAFD